MSYPFWDIPLSRHSTFGLLAGRMTFFNHMTKTLHPLENEQWKNAVVFDVHEFSARFDDRSLNVGFSGANAAILDGEGALHVGSFGKAFTEFLPGKGGPGPRYAETTCIHFDAESGHWLVFGGPGKRETWAATAKGWKQFSVSSNPPADTRHSTATPEGIYAFAQGQLWRWHGEDWTKIGAWKEWKASPSIFHDHALLHDPVRGHLLCFVENRVGVWDGGGFQVLCEIPGEFKLGVESEDPRPTRFALDPEQHRVLAMGSSNGNFEESFVRVLSLDATALAATAAPLPTGGKKVKAKAAPAKVLKPALAIQSQTAPTDAKAVPVQPPEGYELVAVLPLENAHKQAFALYERSEDEGRGYGLGGGAARVELLAQKVEPILRGARRGTFHEVQLVPFSDVDPRADGKYELPSGTTPAQLNGPKLGGFPRFLQNTERGKCPSCKTPLDFVAQVEGFGDEGFFYVFMCPDGCAALAAAQSH